MFNICWEDIEVSNAIQFDVMTTEQLEDNLKRNEYFTDPDLIVTLEYAE